MPDAEERLGGSRKADRAVGAELEHAHVAGLVVEIDEEAVVLRVARVERDREQALLPARADAAADVEERRRAQLPVHEHPDHARLLDDVELSPFAARRAHEDRRVEPGSEGPQAQLRLLASPASGSRQRGGDECHDDPEATHQLLSRTLLNSSSFPGWRMARTWSPGSSSVEPTAISERPLRMIEIRREPLGRSSCSTVFPAAGAPESICTSTISRFSLRSSRRWTRSCSGTSCSISAIKPRVAETVGEIPSRSKCAWLRGSLTRAITFGTPYFSLASWQMIRLSSSSPVAARTRSGGRLIPARSSTWSSVASPRCTACSNSSSSRAKRSGRCSIIVTSCLARSSSRATFAPTFPPPAIRTYTGPPPGDASELLGRWHEAMQGRRERPCRFPWARPTPRQRAA